MSAAAPIPPPGHIPGSAMNGYTHGTPGTGAGADIWRGGDVTGDGRAPGGSFPPVAEIFDSASARVDELRSNTIGRLLDMAKTHFHSAKVQANGRGSAAAAYWEYVVAYKIVGDAIPRHADYYDKIDQSRSQLHREYRELFKDLRTYDERFDSIKQIITNDNKRNGVQARSSQTSSRPSSAASQYTSQTDASSLQGSRLSNGSTYRQRDDELMLPNVPTKSPESSRRKPPVHTKPQSLHGRALHKGGASLGGAASANELAERFAKLRGPTAPLDTSSTAAKDLSVKMPSPSDYHGPSRPLGPRDMPPPPHAPTHPPKLPLDTQFAASMPKEPSPTYSPARNLSLPPSINPPRSTARSMVGTGGRSNSMAVSSVSSVPPNFDWQTDSYFPPQTTNRTATNARRKSINKPLELQITAEKLYDYIRYFNVLLIDVRSREEFDSGHIFVQSIMCIEPTALQDGYSAEQLQDRLVLSPDEEQIMYERRHEYDLVVYYDESTKTNSFLNKYSRNEKEVALKQLYDTLHEFNAEKPLQRPPIFLMGGVDAWADLVGVQALKMSTTATLVASGKTKPSRGVRRTPAVGHAAKLNLQKRRMREYMSMDPEEEQKWLEEARKGRAVFEQVQEEGMEDDATSPMYRTTEDFLRRFPEIEVEQQSMMYPTSRPQPPPQYAPPAVPQAPSRPAPSVPRVSYSGVHERQVTPQGRTSELPVYVSPGRYGQIRLHRTGLQNFGVTCYMNSVVQCLCGNVELTNLFLTNHYQQSLQRENWKGTKGILPEAYATLVSNLFKGDVNSVRPSTFRRICGHFNSQWAIDQQQDAKEFLEFVLDHLHEDLNSRWSESPLKELSETDEMTRERLPRPYVARLEWGRYMHRETSPIGNMFAGQHASQLTCTTCGVTSTTYEAFWSISVEIPRDRPADLRDCLRSYCSYERLSGDEVWRCPQCKRDREAMKKITITRAPDTLVVHFKRFSASHNERAHKVRTPINFPLHGLDLEPFMEPPITPEQEAQVMAYTRDSAVQLTALKTDPAMNGPFKYNAYAVIWHLGGTLGSGHYVAHVRDRSRGCWRNFNDDRIKDFEPGNLPPEDRLQNEKAYIVFYERERVATGVL